MSWAIGVRNTGSKCDICVHWFCGARASWRKGERGVSSFSTLERKSTNDNLEASCSRFFKSKEHNVNRRSSDFKVALTTQSIWVIFVGVGCWMDD